MRPSEALEQKRDAVRALMARYPVENPRLFGSVLRGCDQQSSDLDILVDALPGATLFDLGGLQMDLQELLGVQVDLLVPAELPIQFRDNVLSEAKPVLPQLTRSLPPIIQSAHASRTDSSGDA